MELTLLAPTALSAACSKALAFWAAAGPTAGPSMRADTATNVTSTFLMSVLPKLLKDPKFALRLSQVTADICVPIGVTRNSARFGGCHHLRLEVPSMTSLTGT